MYEVFDLLIEKGANIYDIGSSMDSLMMIGVKSGDVKKLNIVMSIGFDLRKYALKESPLHKAVIYNFKDIVKYLLEWGLDPNSRDKDGMIPLHHAANIGNKEICEMLMEYGSELDTKDYYGITPLHVAVKKNHISIVMFLIACGCNVNPCDCFHRTPYCYSIIHGFNEIQRYLEENDVLSEDNESFNKTIVCEESPIDGCFIKHDKDDTDQKNSDTDNKEFCYIDDHELSSTSIRCVDSEIDIDEIICRIEDNDLQFLELERQFNIRLKEDELLEENIDANGGCKISIDSRSDASVFEA